MRKLLYIIISVMSIGQIFAQNAILKGTVVDSKTGEAVIGANIVIKGTTVGTTTDFDGNYQLTCSSGEFMAEISFISYETKNVVLKLNEGEAKALNVELNESVTRLQQVEVVAYVNRESENLLLMERKNAGKIQESIGAVELSAKGISDVAAGVKKMTGISMIGSHKLFVRGLGDRYNKTQLNSMPISSPNPDERLISLDIFPLSIISSIDVRKVYSAEYYADYSGALIDINTKGFPEKSFFKVKLGTGVNTITSFKDFKSSSTNNEPNLGFDLNSRQISMPSELDGVNQINDRYYFSDEPFATNFGYQQMTASPNMSLGLSGGYSKKLGAGKQFGLVFSSSYGNDYAITQGQDLVLKSDGTNSRFFNFVNYAYSTSFANLLSLNYKHNNSRYLANIIYINNSTDELNEKQGYDGEDYSLFVRTMTYKDHRLFSGQLKGEHELSKSFQADWNLAYSLAQSSEPDRRGVVYEMSEVANGDQTYQYYSLFSLNQGETLRYFSEMRDSTLAGGLNFKYLFNKNNDKNNLHFGIQGLAKNRDFSSFMFFYNVDEIANESAGLSNNESLLDFPNPTNINVLNNINDQAFADSSVYIKNNTQDKDSYQASLNILSAYSELNISLMPKLFLNLGVRIEYSNQTVNFFSNYADVAVLEGLDVFPALNIKYDLKENSNLRFSASKTMTRADFLEMAPFHYRPSYGSATSFGNENIQNADNYNFDFKYESFPNPGELISFAAYGKLLKTPIERISLNQGGGLEYTYANAEGGEVFGFEFEAKKKLMKRISAGVNASYIYTHIEIDEGSSNTFKSHAMMGASPYLINADLMYRFFNSDNAKADVSLVYNVYGRRIFAIGEGGKGDVYELPFNSLNLQISADLYQKWNLTLALKNILNSEKTYVQDVVTINDAGNYIHNGQKTVNSYKIGLCVNIGVSYKF